MTSSRAHNPPRGECSQCWYHAHAGRHAHAHLAPREDCPDCVDHMRNGHPTNLIAK
ncbi:pRL2-8 [Streptomyces sp. NPDC087866]|uniref:pRL2-8 n=1 Tax=Streptomyces TaxID=1883 RepID=UPI0037F8BF2C